MKRRGLQSIFLLSVILLFFSSFVVAQTLGAPGGPLDTFGDFINNLFEFAEPLLNILFGATPVGDSVAVGTFFLVRILLFTIVFAIVWATVTRIEMFTDYAVVEWAITIAVSLLATRWLSSNSALVETILLPYNVLGVSLTAFLPLVVYFFFLEVLLQGRQNKFLRRMGWIFFAVIFTFLWFTRANEIGFSSVGSSGLIIYPICAGLCLLFYMMDGTIQRFMAQGKVDRVLAGSDKRIARGYEVELKKIEDLLQGEQDPTRVRELKRDREQIRAELIKLKAGR